MEEQFKEEFILHLTFQHAQMIDGKLYRITILCFTVLRYFIYFYTQIILP